MKISELKKTYGKYVCGSEFKIKFNKFALFKLEKYCDNEEASEIKMEIDIVNLTNEKI